MLHLHSLSSHVAIRNPRLCSHHSLSSQDSIRTGSKYFEQKNFTSRPTSGSSFAPQSPGGGVPLPPKVFVRHSIYKGKAALTIEPRLPDFTSLDSGAFKISKDGFVLLQFAPAAAVRQYDWSRKQVFSLSVVEIGTLIDLGARDSCEFFHDPFKGRSDEGKVRKVLKVEPLPDGSGHFFNLSVQNKLLNIDESIYIPITKAEYTVLVSAFNLAYDPSEELFGLEDNLQPRNVPSDAPKPRSWFGPNGQYIRELPCPSCRGRGYTPCTECGIERSRLDCSQCNGKGIRTCRRCLGDCVIWEESIDEQPWEKARSVSPLKVKEDDEVDNLEIKLDVRRKSKRVYQSPPPEVGLKISRSLKSLNARTGLFSKRMKIIHGDPLLHAQRVAAIKKAKGTAAARKRASESLKAFFRDPENRRKRSIAMKGVKFYCGNCGREGHRRYYCPEFQDSSIDRQFRCRLCGEKGHNRRTCSKSRSSESKSKVPRRHRCRICGQSGHNSRTCPQVTGVEFGAADGRKGITVSKSRTYSCRLCQEKGHNIRTCPSRNKYPIED